jgi:hypothetical protein
MRSQASSCCSISSSDGSAETSVVQGVTRRNLKPVLLKAKDDFERYGYQNLLQRGMSYRQRGKIEVQLYSFLTLALDGVGGQRYARPLHPREAG